MPVHDREPTTPPSGDDTTSETGSLRPEASSTKFVLSQARHILVVTVVVVVLTVTAMIVMGNWPEALSLAYLVFLFGTVGGIANNTFRLRRLADNDDDAPVGAPDSRLVTFQIYLSPIIGGVFALVLYGLFLSGILTGALFPSFDCADTTYIDFEGFALCAPSENSDVAKLFVWAFAAGFLEGLVPNFISSLFSEGDSPAD